MFSTTTSSGLAGQLVRTHDWHLFAPAFGLGCAAAGKGEGALDDKDEKRALRDHHRHGVLVYDTRAGMDAPCSASVVFGFSAGSSVGCVSGFRVWASMTTRAGMLSGRLGSRRFRGRPALEPAVWISRLEPRSPIPVLLVDRSPRPCDYGVPWPWIGCGPAIRWSSCFVVINEIGPSCSPAHRPRPSRACGRQ